MARTREQPRDHTPARGDRLGRPQRNGDDPRRRRGAGHDYGKRRRCVDIHAERPRRWREHASSHGITRPPAVTGSGDPNVTVTIREGGAVLGTTTANGAGAWSFTPSGLADGANTRAATGSHARPR